MGGGDELGTVGTTEDTEDTEKASSQAGLRVLRGSSVHLV